MLAFPSHVSASPEPRLIDPEPYMQTVAQLGMCDFSNLPRHVYQRNGQMG